MFAELVALGVPAVSIGFVHCVCGPDHYVPFVAMSRVGLWSLRKTLVITILCGIGHVLGSAVIGFIGIGLGLIVWQLQSQSIEATLGNAESVRGDLAGWMLLGFGIIYAVWGLYRAYRTSGVLVPEEAALTNTALIDTDNPYHATGVSSKPTEAATKKEPGRMTPWVLFTVFLFGPCEPLIPMLMVPASQKNMLGVAWITFLFGLTTLLTMTTLVALIYMGAFAVRFPRLQTWGHALAGSVVAMCGAAVLLGL
jgi:nickel/cobalt exporter